MLPNQAVTVVAAVTDPSFVEAEVITDPQGLTRSSTRWLVLRELPLTDREEEYELWLTQERVLTPSPRFQHWFGGSVPL